MTEQRQRQGRVEETAQRRRRRDDTNFQQTAKMAIPEEVMERLKAEGRSPRWVNDERNRIHNLTVNDDYDKVEGVDPVPVGTREDGTPLLAHLLSKPTEFLREDQAKAEARRKATEEGMVKGKMPVKTDDGEVLVPVQGARGAETYADKANTIGSPGRGNKILE
jgi:hypothetical protein